MIICLFILLGQATHLFWDNEPSERLSHKIVQLGQAVAQLNQRTAVVAALRLHMYMYMAGWQFQDQWNIPAISNWKDERPLSWKRQQCEPSLPQPLHPADGIKWNDETEFCLLALEPPTCVCFLEPGQSSHFHWSPEPTIEPRHLGHTALVTWDANINILKLYFIFFNLLKGYFQLVVFLTGI